MLITRNNINERKLKVAVAMSTVSSFAHGTDIDGEWLDVIGVCKLTHEIVRRRVFANGDVLQSVGQGWVPLDMEARGEFRDNIGRRAWA